jgi:hypothetical protein
LTYDPLQKCAPEVGQAAARQAQAQAPPPVDEDAENLDDTSVFEEDVKGDDVEGAGTEDVGDDASKKPKGSTPADQPAETEVEGKAADGRVPIAALPDEDLLALAISQEIDVPADAGREQIEKLLGDKQITHVLLPPEEPK